MYLIFLVYTRHCDTRIKYTRALDTYYYPTVSFPVFILPLLLNLCETVLIKITPNISFAVSDFVSFSFHTFSIFN